MDTQTGALPPMSRTMRLPRCVGKGDAAVAVTDTDDSLEEIKAGSHVAIIFPDRDEGQMVGSPGTELEFAL